MRFFPKELWPTIAPAYGREMNGVPGPKRRALRIHRADKRSRMEMGMDRAVHEGVDDVDEDAADPDRTREEEVEKDGFDDEPIDDNFEEDEEEDDNNDYNAEQYFDGGDDDAGEEEYGGGGGGEEDF